MSLTRNNIAYDFKISPYRLEVEYDAVSISFVFSSELYKKKFYDRFVENREKITESLSKRFGFDIVNDMLCDIRLYSSIEKRGFLLLVRKGMETEWVEKIENIILNGGNLILKI